MDCIINLSRLGTETRKKPVFYASDHIIIYKEGKYIEMADCQGNIISKVVAPSNLRQYEYVDLEDVIIFIFGGKDLIMFDVLGSTPISYRIDVSKVGKVVTPLYRSPDHNGIVFGTQTKDSVQFVNFNFINQQRMSQSQSWKTRRINDMIIYDNTIYAILDSSFIVACDASTCELIWNKFEYSIINPKIIPYDRGILYTCNNVLKYNVGRETQTIKIPKVRISELIDHKEHHLFFTSNNSKNICAFNLKDKVLIWEILGNDPILESLVVKGIKNKSINLAILSRMKNDFSIINATEGRSCYYFKLPGVYKIRQTANNILIHKYNRHTEIIPGMPNDK